MRAEFLHWACVDLAWDCVTALPLTALVHGLDHIVVDRWSIAVAMTRQAHYPNCLAAIRVSLWMTTVDKQPGTGYGDTCHERAGRATKYSYSVTVRARISTS